MMTAYFVRCILFGALVLGSPSFATLAQAQVEVPPVPTDIQVPAGFSAFLKGYAIGTQNFICLAPKKERELAWRFTGPQATLFLPLANGQLQQVTTHFLSANPDENGVLRPTWQHSADTSAVWGRVKASSTDAAYVEAGAIPWLLLEVAGAQDGPSGGDFMTEAVFIHRLNTTGGLAPSTGCSEAADIGAVRLVPYTADYFFYRADQ
jgi:hypothetical protein